MESIENSMCMTVDLAAKESVQYGAQIVHCIEHPNLNVPRTDTYASVLSDMIKESKPWLVLLPLNDFGRELAAFCAQQCQAGMIADCDELVLMDGQVVGRCPAWGGQIMADITLADGWHTALVTVRPQGVELQPIADAEGQIEPVQLEKVTIRTEARLLKRSLESMDGRRLEEARIVVAGGAGLGDMRGFGRVRELAAALGGEVGATRPPVMNHWVDEQCLIGQTGLSIRPNLLITIGTSGAIQYTAGIMESDLIVAINRDPAAPIFQMADIGIRADAAEVLPPLIQQAKKMAMRRLANAACQIEATDTVPRGGFGLLVRQLREARDWTPDDLARKTGQTPDFIAHVEADQMSPPVGFILRMAQAMEVDPNTFLNPEEKTAITDQRTQAYYQRTQNYNYKTLTPDAENSHLRAFMVTIEPHQSHKPVAYKHEGEEFIFVMNGELEFTLGSNIHILKTGESIHFNSDMAHKLKNPTAEITKCLVVVYTI
jgi:electron transfer flavoprotein alpha subunit/quercetin dioxygenase-like cupin family protein